MIETADLADILKAKFPSLSRRASADHPAFNVSAAEIPALLQFLRDERGYDMLSDLTAVDWGTDATPRFSVVWHVTSTEKHDMVRVVSECADDTAPVMPSAVALWPGANWHEREVWDMFGIKFDGHPDLRRILMWDSYPYHPLRKEFPLAGLPADLPDAEIATEVTTRLIPAPMAGGPFVAHGGGLNLGDNEPSAKDESWNERREKPAT
ncbi:MAG: NADH-quinone oxidoreductase subunit C [Opitutaceae bacterium]|jgi:NADH-quinone oxidoreductase subunit C